MLYIVSILCMCPSQSPNSSPYSPFPLVAVHPFEGHYSVAQLCPTLCNLIDCSTPGFPVLHHLPELVQTHVSWVGDAIQPFEGRIKFYCFMANSVLHLSFPGTGTQEIQLTPGLSSSQDWDVCSRNWLEHILSHGVAEGENLQWWVSRKVWGLACRRVPMMRRVDYHLGIGFLFPALSTQSSLPLFLLDPNSNSWTLYTSKSLFTWIRKPDW